MMLKLEPFTEEDIKPHLSWLEGTDLEFLLQYSGPAYSFPLDQAQLLGDIEKMRASEEFLMFKAVEEASGETLGHIQFLNIHREAGTATIGRVLVRKERRGHGFGEEMMRLAIEEAFQELGLSTLELWVYSFNRPAIQCYMKLGFRIAARAIHVFPDSGKRWGRLLMKLDRDRYCKIKTQDEMADQSLEPVE